MARGWPNVYFEAGVTREFVNKIESGKCNVSIRTLEKLAQILDVEIKDLLKS